MEKTDFNPSWVDKAKQGDQDALTGLYTSTYHVVYSTIRSLIKSDNDTVMDLLQDTYIKAFSKLDKLGDPNYFQSWIAAIARNTALDYLRKKKPLLFSDTLDDYDNAQWEPVDTDTSRIPENVIDQNDTERIFHEIIDSLPEKQRVVISMRYYMDMDIDQIARTLGLKNDTVRTRLFYGRKKIEEKIYEIERRDGIRLHGIAPIAFLLFLFKKTDSMAMEPDAAVLSNIVSAAQGTDMVGKDTSSTAQDTGSHVESDASSGMQSSTESDSPNMSSSLADGAAKAAGSGTAKGVSVKIVGIIAAIGVVGAGAAYGLTQYTASVNEEETQETPAQDNTEADSSSDNDSLDAAYEAYAEVYTSIQNQHGDYRVATLKQTDYNGDLIGEMEYVAGIFYANLIDFTGDEIPELVVAYLDGIDEASLMPSYHTEIWSWQGDTNTCLYDSYLPYNAGGDFSGATFAFAEKDGTNYLMTRVGGSHDQIEFLKWDGDDFSSAISFNNLPDDGSTEYDYKINGQKVSEQEYTDTFNEWTNNAEYYCPFAMIDGYASSDADARNQAFIAIQSTEDTLGLTRSEPESSESTEPEEIYKDVLDYYYESINSGWMDYENETMSESEISYIYSYFYSDPSYLNQIGYEFIDLNNDGTDELIIGLDLKDETNYYENVILDLYTYANEEPIHVVSSGERWRYELCDDNTLYYSSSGGASSNTYEHYQLNNSSLELLEGVYSEPINGADDVQWFTVEAGSSFNYTDINDRSNIPISKEEAEKIQNSWPVTTGLSLTPFSNYQYK